MENIFFYGERGIVNGLVLDLKEDLSKLKKVLNSIEWCSEQEKSWINDIENAIYLIEPGFSKFGQPDLVIICEAKDGLIAQNFLSNPKKTLYFLLGVPQPRCC